MRLLPIPPEELRQHAQSLGLVSGLASARRDAAGVVRVREEFRAWLKTLSVTSELKDELDSTFAKEHRRASGQMV